MSTPSLPHYLRTVRALAFVSGVGGVVALSGAGCGSSPFEGTRVGPEDGGAQDSGHVEGVMVAPDSGQTVHGIGPAPDAGVDAGPEDSGPTDHGDAGIDAGPEDSGTFQGIGIAPDAGIDAGPEDAGGK